MGFTVKEVARQLGCSTQYIYSIIPKLNKKGLAYKDNQGRKITNDGLIYLKDEKNKTLKRFENKIGQKTCENNLQPNPYKILYEETLKRCEEQKKEIEYWRTLYIESRKKKFRK